MYQWCDLFPLLVEIICEYPPPPPFWIVAVQLNSSLA